MWFRHVKFSSLLPIILLFLSRHVSIITDTNLDWRANVKRNISMFFTDVFLN